MNDRVEGGISPESEIAAIDLLGDILGKARRDDVIRGMGDDCAVLSFSGAYDVLMTVDALNRDIHFCLDWQSPYGIGWRALASAVSDIAAMGGEPMAVLVAIMVERGWDRSLPGIYEGIRDLSGRLGIDIVGGDVSRRVSGLSLSMTVIGRVGKGKAVYRDGARVGDDIWITGTLGGGGAVQRMAKAGIRDRMWEDALARYEKILPRISEARFLVEAVSPTGMIDVSDGLSTDLSHICRLSGVGAEVDLNALPVDKAALAACAVSGENPLLLALHGGEDFELCFTARRGEVERIAEEFSRRFGLGLSRIGTIVRSGMVVHDREGNRSELKPKGYDHLKHEEGRR